MASVPCILCLSWLLATPLVSEAMRKHTGKMAELGPKKYYTMNMNYTLAKYILDPCHTPRQEVLAFDESEKVSEWEWFKELSPENKNLKSPTEVTEINIQFADDGIDQIEKVAALLQYMPVPEDRNDNKLVVVLSGSNSYKAFDKRQFGDKEAEKLAAGLPSLLPCLRRAHKIVLSLKDTSMSDVGAEKILGALEHMHSLMYMDPHVGVQHRGLSKIDEFVFTRNYKVGHDMMKKISNWFRLAPNGPTLDIDGLGDVAWMTKHGGSDW